MRIAVRLVLTLGLTTAAVMAAYALITQRQREALLGDALIRETETLAHTLQIVTNNALRDRRFADLNRVLQSVVEDPETFMVAVSGRQGNRLAGAMENHVACIPRGLPPLAGPARPLRGWAECNGRIRWVVLPVHAPASTLLLGRRATVMEREIAASRRRYLLLTLTLSATAALAILIVLRRTLSKPLAELMRGVHSLGDVGRRSPVRVGRSAGELGALAYAFNKMAEQLDEQRQNILREAEERVMLERRLLDAEKFAAVGRLTGGVAHELGSPLNVIAMRAETITSLPSAPPVIRHQAQQIIAEVDRIAELVQGLLHVARRHGVNARSLNLSDVVEAAVLDVQAEASASEVELDLNLPDTPVIIHGDATLLRHALLNLLRNALHALKGHPGRRHLSVRLKQGEAQARVTVTDTGPGIADQDLEHVFEPFFTTKDVGEGTGLGLAISRGIVEEHGGHLELTSGEDSMGVCAMMILPVAGPGKTARVS